MPPEPHDPACTPSWVNFPVLAEFHKQWWRARGGRLGEGRLPFSRDWESLLSDAGLTGIELRTEAERDARVMAQGGLLRLKAPPRRPHLIGRVQLPVEREPDLARLFGDPIETTSPPFDHSSIQWADELAFVLREKVWTAPDDLLAINRFFLDGGNLRPMVPIKERSLHIFGDEKRLDALSATRLFGENALTLSALRCVKVPEPLGWRRGPGRGGLVLVLENAATWDSFSRWNRRTDDFRSERYDAVIYGAGHRFVEGAGFLPEIAGEVGSIRRIDYFGDLDPEGLRIPVIASARCRELGLPEPVPLHWAYALLLEQGQPSPLDETGAPDHTAWLGNGLREKAHALFAAGHRLAQEWVGCELLARHRVSDDAVSP